ncbi:MAG: DUF2130 domain-containing protein [Planctomycetota bacterium]|nr:DUF2130 domain-containing protein [Planctomycetota bacterium]
MTDASNSINCPTCGEQIDVNDILHNQVEAELEKKYAGQLAEDKSKLVAQQAALDEQAKKYEERVHEAVREREEILKPQLKAKLAEDQESAMTALREQLQEKSERVVELNNKSIELEKLKIEKVELESTIKAEEATKHAAQLKLEKEKIIKAADEANELKLKDLTQLLQEQKDLTAEMKRKQEQGSMQSQGEVQEVAIEEWLQEQFPLDDIEEIKKGQLGADCLQTVHTRTQANCGTIYYESKRTKSFQPLWIEKFKGDIREKNAQIGVLVTEAMPPSMPRMGLMEGVWVCSFQEFKGLSLVLRQSLIQLSTAMVTQENKGDKMSVLYDYLTGNEFKLQIEAIVEGFVQMKSDLESEQRSMRTIWKKREKQIAKVMLNTEGMYGSIQGIAGRDAFSVEQLELGGDPSLSLEDGE